MAFFGKAQSAIEYLTTYGWTILVVIIVIALLFLITKPSSGSNCIPESGYSCTSPSLNASGYLEVTFSESLDLGNITVTGLQCTTGPVTPSTFQAADYVLAPNTYSRLIMHCPISSSAIGTTFLGYLWIQYHSNAFPNEPVLADNFAHVVLPVTTNSGFTNFTSVITTSTATSSTTSTSTTTSSTTTTIGACSPVSYVYCIGGDVNSSASNIVYSSPVCSNGNLGGWSSQTPYLKGIYQHSCTESGGYIYCVGGLSPSAAGAQISGGSILNGWTAGANYPFNDHGLSCAALNGYIYCVAGSNSNTSADISEVYSAPITGNSIGAWTLQQPYPIADSGLSCVNSTSGIACVGGASPTPVNNEYSAPVSGGTLSSWTYDQGLLQASQFPGCTAWNGYIYCIGGTDGNATYSATIASGGTVGTWAAQTPYPLINIAPGSCVASNGHVYCIGGIANGLTVNAVYGAPLSANVVGAWSQQPNYPAADEYFSCVVD